jgi:hypothetical protein
MATSVLPAGSARPPEDGLLLAAQMTSLTSFRVRSTVTLRFGPTSADRARSGMTEGVYDARNRRGSFTIRTNPLACRILGSTPSATGGVAGIPEQDCRTAPLALTFEERLLGNDCYVRFPNVPAPSWLKRQRCGFGTGVGADLGADIVLNVQELLDQLKTIGTATYKGRTGHGENATDHWAFSNANRGAGATEPTMDAGTISVNVATNWITQITSRITTPDLPEIAIGLVTEFTDFGLPVEVSPPSTYQPQPSSLPPPTR